MELTLIALGIYIVKRRRAAKTRYAERERERDLNAFVLILLNIPYILQGVSLLG